MRWDYDPRDSVSSSLIIVVGILIILVAGYYLGGAR